MKDPYQTLGVPKSASQPEVKKAYHKLAQKFHPDKNPDDKAAEEMFKDVNRAYDIIGDAEKRTKFDRGQINAEGQTQHGTYGYSGNAQGGFGGGFGGRPGRARGRGGFDFDDMFKDEDVFSDFFKRQGARPGGRQHSAYEEGVDIRYALKVTFEEAARGDKTRVSLTNGKKLDIKLPAGIKNGGVIRLKGQGKPGRGGGKDGDALIEVAILAHPHYSRTGNDVHLDLPITLREAVLGAKVLIPTIHGSVTLTIPEHSNTGTSLRVKNKGIRQGQTYGDQIVKLKVVLPDEPDKQLDTFLKHWRPAEDNPRKKSGLK